MQKSKSKGLSIFYRLWIVFLGVVLIVSGALTVIFYAFSRSSLQKNAEENILQQFEAAGAHFDSDFKHTLTREQKILASNPVIDEFMMSSDIEADVIARDVERLFLKYIHYSPGYRSICLVDYSGNEKIRVNKSGRIREYQNLSESGFFKKIASGAPNSIHVEGPFKDTDGTIFFSTGIHKIDADIGEFGGTIITDYSLEEFIGSLDRKRVFGENPIWVFGSDGQVLKRPGKHEAVFDPRPYMSKEPKGSSTFLSLKDGMLVYQDLSIVPSMPFVRIAISIPSRLLLGDLSHALNFFSLIFLLSIVITTLIAFYLSRCLSRPVIELARAAEGFSKGELSTQVKIKTTGEIKLLVDSFNQISRNLEKTTVSRDYVEEILESMHESLVVVSAEGNIQTVNKATCALLGYEEKELIGRPMEDMLFPKHSFVSIKVEVLEKISRERVINNIQTCYLTKDGREIPMLFSGSVMSEGKSDFHGIICIAVDITDRNRADVELKRFSDQLERSNKELQDFTHIASHDLQEPLRKVSAFGDRLKTRCGEALGDQGNDYLERMQNAVERMRTLINGLLTFSQVNTKGQPFFQVDLGRVTQEVISDLEVRIEESGGRVEVDELPTIDADPLQMRQLLQNLIGNALKFHRKENPPLVKIKAEPCNGLGGLPNEMSHDNGFCTITVHDNGIGFDDKHVDRIFGVFQRLHGRSEYEGTGIGLSVCKKIAERHGGMIKAESAPGKGTKFMVTLQTTQPNRVA